MTPPVNPSCRTEHLPVPLVGGGWRCSRCGLDLTEGGLVIEGDGFCTVVPPLAQACRAFRARELAA